MDKNPKNKSDAVKDWLKNLAQESWQLELLVSAFTIFLLIAGQNGFDKWLSKIPFFLDLQSPGYALIYIFLGMVGFSFKILIISLISHLLIRGFWIGTIGLRSVQDHVDWEDFKYSDFFTQKLKSRIRNLDELVLFLDEVCSVIFSLTFLLISIILAFALTIIVAGSVAAFSQYLVIKIGGTVGLILTITTNTLMIFYVLTALIYMIDFFSLGWIKKFNRISRIYYPFYNFYGFITASAISRSIYYHLISRYKKSKIRIAYLIALFFMVLSFAISFDHDYFFSSGNESIYSNTNYYDEYRQSEYDFIEKVSVPSKIVDAKYFEIFIRYDPNDNGMLKELCPNIEIKDSGLFNLNFSIGSRDANIKVNTLSSEDRQSSEKLECLRSMYQLIINDSIIDSQDFSFQIHPLTSQRGLVTMLSAELLQPGENLIEVRKRNISEFRPWAILRVWK
ncbi:hypothetical protein HZR84_08340 [Hyphobacterium sp. CCMP332]|nr:hypothetical protein HZR84_08340 [Hyphobacterium sp. CCMP332]